MDWYYPILGGLIPNKESILLRRKFKDSFWIQGLGIKCVSDEPG